MVAGRAIRLGNRCGNHRRDFSPRPFRMGLKDKIAIWQQNVNKSPICQHDLISSSKLTSMNIDIVALQEPAIVNGERSIAARDWITVYPTPHLSNPEKTRSLMLIRAHFSMDSWQQIDFPSSDVTAVRFVSSEWGELTIFNIYNDGESNNTINLLTKYHKDNRSSMEQSQLSNAHLIWLGD